MFGLEFGLKFELKFADFQQSSNQVSRRAVLPSMNEKQAAGGSSLVKNQRTERLASVDALESCTPDFWFDPPVSGFYLKPHYSSSR
jgi:hypothetical protein